MSHIFISYSKKDLEFVRYLRALLHAEAFTVWLDDELHPGEDWWERLEQQIHGCAAFLVVMSPSARDSRYVRRELLLAEHLNLPVFPVLLAGEVWANLADLQYADLRSGLHAKLPAKLLQSLQAVLQPQPRSIDLMIEYGDILSFEADVVAFKYAQHFHGAELIAASALSVVGIEAKAISPTIGDYRLTETSGALTTPQALFVGTPPLRAIGYKGIHKLASESLRFLAEAAPQTRHLAMTMHGAGFGLDEQEAFNSQLSGYLEALNAGTYPPTLEKISIVEFNAARAQRLLKSMQAYFDGIEGLQNLEAGCRISLSKETLPKPPKKRVDRTYAYVVMPVSRLLDDVFYYGIQVPVHAQGLLCERMGDQDADDDPMKRMMERIDDAAVIIADLSMDDPQVLWQIGYAWGKQRPVILITSQPERVIFTNTPYMRYSSIRDVETALAAQLDRLKTERKL